MRYQAEILFVTIRKPGTKSKKALFEPSPKDKGIYSILTGHFK
jgi:hypothetical protein